MLRARGTRTDSGRKARPSTATPVFYDFGYKVDRPNALSLLEVSTELGRYFAGSRRWA
jgi:hypothetical protein